MAACRACGKENPEGFAFCGSCGTPLNDVPVSTEERKTVSVLFCDLVGFTTDSEAADPEDVKARLAAYHTRVRDEIEAFGGVVEKFVGDAVMAIFGAPVAHEDDPERAVRAGLRVLEAIEEMNDADPTLGLAVRIAVNTGEAIVTLGARPELGEAMVAGDVVNTASRLQGAAPTSSVVVGEGTHRATTPIFVWEELPAVELKGKAERTPLWRVLEARGRFGVDVAREQATPFVGREDDLSLLTTIYARSVRDRSVQLATLIGEPGVGKTRLVAELGEALDDREELITWRQGRCLPYGDGIAFWALGEIVKAQAGILDSDPVDVARDKLSVVLEPLGDEGAWIGQRLSPLLGADALTQAQQEETFTAWRRFLESIASRGPAVLVVEDLHWADPLMVAFLDHVADWSTGAAIMIVATARPEFLERFPTWGAGRRNALTLALSPLSDVETSRLVETLLDDAVLPTELRGSILERAGGNPLYAVEFARMLLDRGVIDAAGALASDVDIAVPDTVQALIAARLDTLDQAKKGLIHDAGVIGKVFWTGALVAMGDRDPDTVRAMLHDLSSKELVRPDRSSSLAGEDEFAFWHALVGDVAYSQIPKATRADKHLSAARWIEAVTADRPQEVAEILIHHYDAAIGYGADVDALRPGLVRALRDAGSRARWTDLRAARQHLERAVDLASTDQERGEIGDLLVSVLTLLGEFDRALAMMDDTIRAFEAAGDAGGVATALITRTEGNFRLMGMGTPDDEATIARAISMLDGQGPTLRLARAYRSMASQLYVQAEFARAIGYADMALQTLEQVYVDPFEARLERSKALVSRGVCRMLLGDGEGEVEAEGGLAELTSIGAVTPPDHLMLAEARLPLRGPAAALEAMRTASELARTIGDSSSGEWAGSSSVYPLFDLGEWDEAVSTAEELLLRAEERGGTEFVSWARSLAALISVLRGKMVEASTLIDPALARVSDESDGQLRAMAISAGAAVASMQGDPELAVSLVTALADSPDLRSDWYYVSRVPLLARACIAAGRSDLIASLIEGIDPAPPGHTNVLATIDAVLLERAGDDEQAARAYADAAARWASFPSVPERAFALLGAGRCDARSGGPNAGTALNDARAIFVSLGASPMVAEADAMLAQLPA